MRRALHPYKGLTSDIARDTISSGFYIDALDIRITTDVGDSMGAITNVRGNKTYFELPTNETNQNGVMEIIGATSIRNTIIIFCADDSDTNGWVWKFNYEDDTQNIIGGLDLVYYSNELRFSKTRPIKAIGRFESGSIQRVYWTDYDEYLRSLNIADPNSINTNIGLVDIFPDIIYTQPRLTNVVGGGQLLAGLWQYAYLLVTSDGKETLISPPGNMIHTVQDLESELQDRAYNGNAATVNTGKALEITIDTSNYTDYENIRLIAIFHEDPTGTPQIFSVEEKAIAGANQVVFLHSGSENTITELDIADYTTKTYPFKTVKTMTQKDNSLVVANIKGSGFDIQDLLPTGQTFTGETIRYRNDLTPSPSGAFNAEYNKDAHWEQDWHTNDQYKYQANGTRLGGEGPNIKYNFHLEPFIVDNAATPEFPTLNDIGAAPVDLNDGYGNYTNLTWSNNASPFISGLLRGYKRGETYRFGIVFYNRKGETSFVEYIGDIKFPDISEEDSVVNDSGTNYFPLSRETADNFPTSVETTAYALGIEFELDFTSCPALLDFVTSYQIVRLPRTKADTRRLCTGIMKIGMKFDITSQFGGGLPGSSVSDGYNLAGPADSQEILHLFTYHQNRDADDNPTTTGYGVNGSFATINNRLISSLPFPAYGSFLTFYSPEISFEDDEVISEINSNACLLMTGRYGQYYSAINNSVGTGVSQTFTTNGVNEGTSQKSFQIVHSQPASTENLGGDKHEDHRRKLRSVGQVDKAAPADAIEYIKKWKQVTNVSFNQSAQDDAVMASELATALGPYDGFSDAGGSESLYFRNFFTYLGNNAAGLNDHSDNAGAGNKKFRSIFHKGATGVTGSIERITVDPLTNQGVSVIPATNYYDTGVTIGTGPVKPVQNIAPLNKSVEDESYSSTPILDVLIPRQEVYGGLSQDALESNVFMAASPVIAVANLNPKVFGGDIFLNMFTFQESCGWLWDLFYQNAGYTSASLIDQEFYENRTSTISMVTESTINLNLSYGSTVFTEVKFAVSGGPSGIQDEIWRQENNNFSSTWGKRNADGQYAMYSGVYNQAYSIESDDIGFFIKPANFDSAGNVNDIRAYLSDVKINEEIVDSWTNFGANNFYDVDDYGPINEIVTFKDTVFFYQDKAIGRYSINPRAITSPSDGIETELGSATGIQDHVYITNKQGAIHQWGVKETDMAIYSYDGIHKKILRVTQGASPLSELKSVHGLLKNFKGDISLRKENEGDNPILNKGVHITRDRINNEVWFTFLGTWKASSLEGNTLYSEGEFVQVGENNYVINSTYTSLNTSKEDELLAELESNSSITLKLPEDKLTLVFDEVADQFSSRYSATPPIYIENGDILLSPNPDDRDSIYIHDKGNWGEFYGERKESFIKLVLNENADINKILRSLEFNSIVRDNEKNIDRDRTITAFRVETEYQDTGKVDFDSGRIKLRFDKWRVDLPQVTNERGKKNRLRSTYFELTLYFDNTYNRELILNRILYYYDIQML